MRSLAAVTTEKPVVIIKSDGSTLRVVYSRGGTGVVSRPGKPITVQKKGKTC